MVDVTKLTDDEIRTKLLEYGFPVMPITGTTRNLMVKKLKILMENSQPKQVGFAEGRRSLGRYSSGEDSDDSETKAVKNQKNRRVTMAAPVSSTSASRRSKPLVEPETKSHSPKRQITSSTTTTTATSRSSKILQSVKDDFDTGSDSESDIVASTNKSSSSSKNDESFNDVEFNRRHSPVKSSLSSSYTRYTSPKIGESSVLNHSLASDYASEKLEQMRARLSLGSPAYERSSTPYTSQTSSTLEDKDTPFLSNFTKRLSALNSQNKKSEFEKSDSVKEHDTNGSYGRSYLTNFRATRGRDLTYGYKNRARDDSKSNFVSYAVLVGFFLFFIVLGIIYLGMRSDTAQISSGYQTPICVNEDPLMKRGVNCIAPAFVETAVYLLNSIQPELHKRAVAHKCFDSTIKPHMTEPEIITFCQSNFKVKDSRTIRDDLRNLQVLTFANPEWGLSVVQKEDDKGPVHEEDVAKNMEQVLFNLDKKVTSLVIFNPTLPYKCMFFNYIASTIYTVLTLVAIFGVLSVGRFLFKVYRNYEDKQKDEVNVIVEKILEILHSAATENQEQNYVVINHVRDEILTVKERKAKQKLWEKAVKYMNENESRVRTEVQTVHGESFDVWRWIGSANLSMSMSGNSPRKGIWQGQAFDTDPGAANSVAYSPTPCLKIRGMLEEGATNSVAFAAREAVLSKIAHRCRLAHCQPETNSGVIYLRCGDEHDASVAFKNLHGWWYSGQLVTVKYLRLERYMQRFPDAPAGPPFLRSNNPWDD